MGRRAVAELQRGDVLQAGDERAEGAIVIGSGGGALKIGVDRGDGAAQVADFVAVRGNQNARAGHELFEARFLTIAQGFRDVDDYGGETRAGTGSIGGKPDTGEKSVAARAPAAALHLVSKHLGALGGERDTGERGQVIRDGGAGQAPRLNPQQLMGGFIGQQDFTGGVQGEDGGGARFNQDAKLFLGIAAELDFGFNVLNVAMLQAAILGRFVDKQSGAEKRGETQDHARDSFTGDKSERIEDFDQPGAQRSGYG